MRFIVVLFLFFASVFNYNTTFAQDSNKISEKVTNTIDTAAKQQSAATIQQAEMADVLYSNGKIYVVVIVLAIIFAALIIFLIHLERKISKIERK
jgi:type IV secretory pathway component VirB8